MIDFFKKVLAASENVVGLNRRNFEFIYKLNQREDFALADDKVLAKEFLASIGVPVPKTYKVYRYLAEVEQVQEDLKDFPTFVIKPANGSRGDGILIVNHQNQDGYHSPSGRLIPLSQMKYFVASILFGKFSLGHPDHALVEEKLVPPYEIQHLATTGLPDIRVLVAREKVVMCMLRLPSYESQGKANLHQGGVGVGVDIETGRCTSAIHKGKVVTIHPDTEEPLLGQQVPYWKEILHYAAIIGKASPLKYIGIDFTLDQTHGPMVLEFNVRPGLEIQNANQVGLLGRLR